MNNWSVRWAALLLLSTTTVLSFLDDAHAEVADRGSTAVEIGLGAVNVGGSVGASEPTGISTDLGWGFQGRLGVHRPIRDDITLGAQYDGRFVSDLIDLGPIDPDLTTRFHSLSALLTWQPAGFVHLRTGFGWTWVDQDWEWLDGRGGFDDGGYTLTGAVGVTRSVSPALILRLQLDAVLVDLGVVEAAGDGIRISTSTEFTLVGVSASLEQRF
ncbi:MAG TPA: hypothetical protein VKA86_17965 [Candidatus Krumholzibacteria bacterium]|nr:hypothetical protein [Candidatus Krumholzibacteria bacterium]